MPYELKNNYLTYEDAVREANRISEHWRALGFTISVKLVNYGFCVSARQTVWGLESDLLNAIPKDAVFSVSERKFVPKKT